MKSQFKIGDNVAYSVQWLKSTGQTTGDYPFARGKIVGLVELSSECILAEIDWGCDEFPKRVNIKNLAKVGLNSKFSSC